MTFNFDNDNETHYFDVDGEFMVMVVLISMTMTRIQMVNLVKFIMFVIDFMIAMVVGKFRW